MSETKPNEERIIELLEELVKWTKVRSIPEVKKMLEELVKTPEEKRAYTISDGKKTTREVAEITQTNKNSISKSWRKWIKSGIAQPIEVKGGGKKARSIFSLEDFGIKVPAATGTRSVPEEDKKEETEQKPEVEK